MNPTLVTRPGPTPTPERGDACERCGRPLPLPVDRQRGFHDYACVAAPASIGAD